MSRYLSVFYSLSTLLVVASGCCCFENVYRPSHCTPSWSPRHVMAEESGDCGTGCVGCSLCQRAHNRLSCCSGCGDIYWGEWLSHPPDDCDPCDDCGNWIGPRCCLPNFREWFCSGVSGLWGWRCGPEPSCDHGSGCCSHESHELGVLEDYEDGTMLPMKPGEPRKATPAPPQAAPQKGTPDVGELPHPMLETRVPHGRSPRVSSATRGKRPTQQSSASGPMRPRAL
jgi:hypothetical protein